MSYSTYITSWDKNPYDQVQDMLNNNVIKPNTRIILAFASFNFSSTTYIPGLNNLSIDDLIKLTSLVHSNNSKISLSIGGATYPFYNSDLYSKPGDLANNINIMLNKCNFDGVDFDIEDSSTNVPSDFASNTASLINTLRSLNNSLNITLTTPAQAWGATNYQQSLLNMTIGNINSWQPMEYDLWINPTLDYYSQIEFDIDYYINTWGVNSNKIILGLMPGKNDLDQDLTLVDALNLTTYAKNNELQGVMTWDANIDSKGVDSNAPYAYSLGIESILNNNNKYNNDNNKNNKNKNKNILYHFFCCSS
jgi:GH18 family chitinase